MRLVHRTLLLLTALVLAATLLPGVAISAAEVYPGAQYREEYFEMGDTLATRLHADVLRDEDTSWSVEQPVVLVVSPYTNHNGSTTDLDPLGGTGPNARFYDFLDVTGALQEGYTFAQVDLPGNGGSSGCNDWGGSREQGAVHAAVEWAARQPWSNGNVALLGKSYDGWTGLMGMATDPEGLAAVISQEPVFSGYRYLYNNGVRFVNSVTTNALFQVVDAKPGALNDDPEYHLTSAPQAWCYGLNIGLQQQDSEDVAFWADRDLVRQAAGSDVPLFLTQGWLETNTKPDAALDFWNAMDHSHGENVAWFGQFNHVRGWEQTCGWDCEGEFLMGREDFAEQIMVFLDEHLKGIEPEEDLQVVAVQDNLGRYRNEAQYPPADMQRFITTGLNVGSYNDGVTGGSLWSTSQVLDHDVWMAGEPVFTAGVTTTVPRGNLTVLVHDVDPDSGRATLVSRGTTLIRGTGEQQVDLQMYGQDWVFEQGHRIAVQVKATDGFWVHVPTGQDVTVTDADLSLPLLTEDRTEFVEDAYVTTELRGYDDGVDASAIPDGSQISFTLPGPLS